MHKIQTEENVMKVYKFKCKNCGATSYDKVGSSTYKCKYCGNTEEVFTKNERDENQDNEIEELKGVIQELTDAQRTAVHEYNDHMVKSALVNFLICLFVGYLGIHRFIEGKYISGVLYLCTVGLFGIGVGFDCLIRLIKLISAIKNNR